MRCRECGAATRVLSTREHTEGFILRRQRECGNGHRFFSYEIDDSLERTILKYAAGAARLATIHRAVQLWWRNKRIIARLKEGAKHNVVAAEFNLSDNMVSTIARKAGLPNAYEQRRTVRPQADSTRDARPK